MPGFKFANPLAQHALGLYVDREFCCWTLVRKSPRGVRILDTRRQEFGADGCTPTVERILRDHIQKYGVKSPIVISVPVRRTLLATVELSGDRQTAAALLASGQVCGPGAGRDLEAELLRFKLSGRSFGTLVACRRSDLEPIVSVANSLGITGMRVEPALCALMRGAPGRRGAGLALRVLASDDQALAVLTKGSQPLLWRVVDFESPDPEARRGAVASLIRSLEFYTQQHFGATMDVVHVQGAASDAQWAQRLETAHPGGAVWTEGAGADGQSISQGLALGAWPTKEAAVDLGRALRPPASLASMVPRGELAVLTSVVICGAGWVWMSIGAMESKADWLDQSQRKEPQLARLSEPELRTAASNLRDQVGAVQRFLGTRMIWSELLGELPQRLPQDVRIAALWGEEELGSGGKAKEGSPKKQKQRVLMDMTSSFPLDVPAPPELELVLQSVRQMESISARYPDVKLASLRLDNNRRKDATEDSAKFSILCLPKVRKAPTDSAAGGGSTEGAQ